MHNSRRYLDLFPLVLAPGCEAAEGDCDDVVNMTVFKMRVHHIRRTPVINEFKWHFLQAIECYVVIVRYIV